MLLALFIDVEQGGESPLFFIIIDVVDMAHQLGGLSWAMSEFSWDVKFAGVQLLASMVSFSYYQSHN